MINWENRLAAETGCLLKNKLFASLLSIAYSIM